MATSIDNVKTLLRIEDTSEDTILSLILQNTESLILQYINAVTLPIELEYVAEEITVTRYNKMMTDGLQTSADTGVSSTTRDILLPYRVVLDLYVTSGNRCKFI